MLEIPHDFVLTGCKCSDLRRILHLRFSLYPLKNIFSHTSKITQLKKSSLPLVCAIFAISIFQACKKTAANSCPEISASVTTPVQAGGTIELRAPDYDNVAFYHWTGPNGFESSDQNAVITNAQGDYAGRYTLEVGILDGC